MTRQRVDICTAWQKVSGVFKAPAVLAVAILLSLSGCGKESHAPGTVRDSAPANVMLVLGSPSVKSGEDYSSIRSIRIYAFRHDSADTQPVGYFYNADVNGEGPFYCPVDLSESGPIDFLVLLNDDRIKTDDSNRPDGSTTRSKLESITFTDIIRQEGDGTGAIVPMCNERITDAEAEADADNFTFNVEPDAEWQIIPIDVKRSVGRVVLNLAKSGDIDVTVTSVILRKGPQTAPLVLADNVINGTSHYYSSANGSEILTGPGSEAELQEGEPATIAETMLLPNPYGSSDPDSFNASVSNYADKGEEKSYRLEIKYTVTHSTGISEEATKTVYLPQAIANRQITVEGTISSRTDVTMNVIVNSWTEHDIDVPPFE